MGFVSVHILIFNNHFLIPSSLRRVSNQTSMATMYGNGRHEVPQADTMGKWNKPSYLLN